MSEPAVVAPAAVAEPVATVVAPVVTAPIKLDEPVVTAPAALAEPAVQPVEYNPTGDAGLDVALAFVGKLGVGLDHPAMQATATGDFSLIKAHLATMGDKAQGWEQMVALAEQAHTRSAAAKTAQEAAIATAVHSVAGGEKQWADIKAWASANATPEEKAAINAMFDAGPFQARSAAQTLTDLYRKAKGTTISPATATQNTSAGNSINASGPLSSREYGTAVRALRAKFSSDTAMNASPEYAQLRSRIR